MHTADLGVYAAKQAGRNCVRFGREDAPATATAVMRIIAVEDDPLAARLLTFLFEKRRDLSLTVFTTGEKALEALSASGPLPRMLLCDLNLPGMDGIAVIRAAKGLAGGDAMTAAILSASSDPIKHQQAAAAGIRFFLEKGDFCTNFERWIETLLQPSPPLQAAA